jgi:hypothetical protein
MSGILVYIKGHAIMCEHFVKNIIASWILDVESHAILCFHSVWDQVNRLKRDGKIVK